MKKAKTQIFSKTYLLPHVPTKEKILAFVEVCKRMDLLVLFTIQCFLGLRLGSALRLKWTDVNLDLKRVFIKDDKNTHRFEQGYGKDRILPIPDFLLPILKTWKNMSRGEEHVIPNKKSKNKEKSRIRRYEEAYSVIYDKLGMRQKWVQMKDGRWRYKFSPHSSRHVCGTNLSLLGCPIMYIKEFLGHSKLEETMVYIHLANEMLRRNINKAYEPDVKVVLQPQAEQLMQAFAQLLQKYQWGMKDDLQQQVVREQVL